MKIPYKIKELRQTMFFLSIEIGLMRLLPAFTFVHQGIRVKRFFTQVYNFTREGLKINSALSIDSLDVSRCLVSLASFRKILTSEQFFILDRKQCLTLLDSFLRNEYSPQLKEKFVFMDRIGRWHEIQKQRNEMTQSDLNEAGQAPEKNTNMSIKHSELQIKKQRRFWKELQKMAFRSKKLILDA